MNRIILAGFAGLLICTGPALAQTVATPTGPLRPVTPPNPNAGPRKVEPPPPALPGARAEPTAVAPSERVPADMPPTEALFDAINRGDYTAAKDAIARGADIQGRNILGLTPTELAVDLGRNNISFLLLSLRGGAGYNTNGPTPQPTAQTQVPADRRAAARAEREARLQAQREARQQAAAEARTGRPMAPRTPRLFAGDGGSPVPQAGFLGFEPAR